MVSISHPQRERTSDDESGGLRLHHWGPKQVSERGIPPLRSVFIECGPVVHHLGQREKQTDSKTD